jgi:hypothetical protein
VIPCAWCGYNQGKQPVLWTWALRDELLAPSRLEQHRWPESGGRKTGQWVVVPVSAPPAYRRLAEDCQHEGRFAGSVPEPPAPPAKCFIG